MEKETTKSALRMNKFQTLRVKDLAPEVKRRRKLSGHNIRGNNQQAEVAGTAASLSQASQSVLKLVFSRREVTSTKRCRVSSSISRRYNKFQARRTKSATWNNVQLSGEEGCPSSGAIRAHPPATAGRFHFFPGFFFHKSPSRTL
jgi:hypothetical protein